MLFFLFKEYYDLTNNRATTINRVNFQIIRKYFLYNTNEMIKIIDDSICEVSPLDTSIDPFGLITVNSSTYHINSPSFVLKFGFNLSVYTTINYIKENLDKYFLCIYRLSMLVQTSPEV